MKKAFSSGEQVICKTAVRVLASDINRSSIGSVSKARSRHVTCVCVLQSRVTAWTSENSVTRQIYGSIITFIFFWIYITSKDKSSGSCLGFEVIQSRWRSR
ncbi:unnamed protein product [Brassica oleracea]